MVDMIILAAAYVAAGFLVFMALIDFAAATLPAIAISDRLRRAMWGSTYLMIAWILVRSEQGPVFPAIVLALLFVRWWLR